MTATDVVELLVYVVRGYLILGLVFAVPFALFLVQRVDPSVPGSTWGFRVIIIPGAALFWPLLLWRVVRGQKTPAECNAHRAAAARISPERLVRKTES